MWPRVSIAILVAIGAIILNTSLEVNWDASFFLHASRKFFAGGRYSTHFFETTPPLALLVHLPAVSFADLLHLPVVGVFKTYVFSLCALSSFLCFRMLRPFGKMLAIDLTLITTAALILLPAESFGQREHLSIVLVFPYIFLMAARLEGLSLSRPLASLVGVLAGIGFGIKPFFVIPLCMAESYFYFRRRRFEVMRPEILGIVAVTIGYAVSLWFFFSDYFTVVLPIVAHLYYPYIARPIENVIFAKWTIFYLASAGFYFTLHKLENRIYTLMCLVAGGFFVAYVAGRTPWYYHALPFLILSLVLMISLTSYFAKEGLRRRAWLAGAFALIMIFNVTVRFVYYEYEENRVNAPLEKFAKANMQNSSVYFLSTTGQQFPVIFSANLKYASRFPILWPLPGILERTESGELDERTKRERHYFVNAIVEDFERNNPEWVLVDTRIENKQLRRGKFDYVSYFCQFDSFRQVWKDYSYVGGTVDYEYYKRR